MADNYLERRMDDYRSGKLGATRHLVYKWTLGAADGYPELRNARVFIIAASTSALPEAKAMVSLLRSAGCRVAFTDSDSRTGNQLAQVTGAQCHPIDIMDGMALQRSRELITRRWGGIDFEITIPEDSRW